MKSKNTYKKKTKPMEYETIHGQVISKANNYIVAADNSGTRHIVKNDAIRQYESNFVSQCRIYKDRLIDRNFILHIEVFEQSNVYDLDNALKTILDCLQYVKAIVNDNLCVGIHARKHIDRRDPRILFAIEELEPNLFF